MSNTCPRCDGRDDEKGAAQYLVTQSTKLYNIPLAHGVLRIQNETAGVAHRRIPRSYGCPDVELQGQLKEKKEQRAEAAVCGCGCASVEPTMRCSVGQGVFPPPRARRARGAVAHPSLLVTLEWRLASPGRLAGVPTLASRCGARKGGAMVSRWARAHPRPG